MSARSLSPEAVREALKQVPSHDGDARPVAIEARAPWTGQETVEANGKRFRVVRAGSALELREALLRAEDDPDPPTVILSALSNNEVGADVRARIARARVFSLHPWETLCGLFRAGRADTAGIPAELMRALIDAAPPGGYTPVPSGLLDAGAAWSAFFEHRLRLSPSELDLAALLLWASSDEGAGRFRALASEPKLAKAARERIVQLLREPGDSVLRFLESGGESAPSPLAIAAACGAIFSEAADAGVARTAAVRLERHHGELHIPEHVGRRLGQAAVEAAGDLEERRQHGDLLRHLDAADALLDRVGAAGLAHLSPLTPLGYKRRVARLGEGISQALARLERETVRRCEELADEVGRHRLRSAGAQAAAERAGMAVRLLRWLERGELPAPGAFGSEVEAYVSDVSWVDFAREVLSAGDPEPEASAAYQALDRAVAARRRRISERFAAQLRGWIETGGPAGAAAPVEEAISRIVVPLVARKLPVLLVVVDGMSWAVAREVLGDARSLRWAEPCAPEGTEGELALIAAVPSVTECSRASLFSGELAQGAAADEKRSFASHAGLLSASERGKPPILFHKADLTESPRGPLADDVREAILDTRRKVVGAVINAIDDRLANAQQARERWTIESIHPLAALLEAAGDANRVVVIASDHGHVLHRDGDGTAFPDAGERWRPAVGEPRAGEVLLRGRRVCAPGGARGVIVPWDEGIRYGVFKNGYHGGAAPEEMLAPLVILARRGRTPPGLAARETPVPEWWQAAPRVEVQTPAEPATAEPSQVRLSEDLAAVANLPIFRAAIEQKSSAGPRPRRPELSDESWIERLFGTDAYLAQRQLVKRHAPGDDEVRKVLETLDRHGGALTRIAFAQKVGVDSLRVDDFLAKVARLLNIDGYEVIRLDRERDLVSMQKELLLKQFGVE